MPVPDYAEILADVEDLIRRFIKNPVTIEEDTELVNGLGLDSLLVMEVIQEVEDRFDIFFPLNTLAEIRTVKDFVLQIQREIGG
ncbi:MAG: acyl carrier protein [Deltaproteobacteria bacterium]|nr:acyl carrier protein [Deltaproteobacteria bacterium]NCP03770.1 acyl carrier protein [Deltaproteobacteria bacterium]NCP78476.1 acyl carrier protein [Desulfuromonadales bacterium]